MSLSNLDISKAASSASQQSLTPADVHQMLKDGNSRFLAGTATARNHHASVKDTADGQWPYAAILSCIDSRVPTEILFDQGIGNLFNACVAGNFVNTDILGSIEYACKVAGSKLVMVLGHTGCGGVKGACDHIELGNITALCKNIYDAVDATESAAGEDRSSKNGAFVNRVAANNVRMTIEKMKTDSPLLKEMADAGEIAIVGGMYDVGTGKVEFYN